MNAKVIILLIYESRFALSPGASIWSIFEKVDQINP